MSNHEFELPCYVAVALAMAKRAGRKPGDPANPWIVTDIEDRDGRPTHAVTTEYYVMPLFELLRVPEPGIDDPARAFRYVETVLLGSLPKVPGKDATIQKLATYFAELEAWLQMAGGAELALSGEITRYSLGAAKSGLSRPVGTFAWQVLVGPLLGALELPSLEFEAEPGRAEPHRPAAILSWYSGWAASAAGYRRKADEARARDDVTSATKADWHARWLDHLASGEPIRTSLAHAARRWPKARSFAARQTQELRRRLREDRLPELKRMLPAKFQERVRENLPPLYSPDVWACYISAPGGGVGVPGTVRIRVGSGGDVPAPSMSKPAEDALSEVERQVETRGPAFEQIDPIRFDKRNVSRFEDWFFKCFDVTGKPLLSVGGGLYQPQWRRLTSSLDRSAYRSYACGDGHGRTDEGDDNIEDEDLTEE